MRAQTCLRINSVDRVCRDGIWAEETDTSVRYIMRTYDNHSLPKAIGKQNVRVARLSYRKWTQTLESPNVRAAYW